ncbi:MAG: hypothetical protein ACERKK_07460 [Poseidonibacter sp.]|uniref:hypothetical protein n=1 Tax=Poseidonibacter sp. TaxID=2321188 RepID=UPI00359EB100
MRSLHRDLGYFVIGITLLYSISGIILSGRALGWLVQEYNANIIMSKNITQKEFNKLFIIKIKEGKIENIFPESSYTKVEKRLNLKVKKQENEIITYNAWKNLNVYYNKNSGQTDISYKGYPVVVKMFLDAHKSTHEKAWFYLAILYSLVLSFLAISAMFMVKGKFGFKKRGIYFMFAGIVVVVAFLAIS